MQSGSPLYDADSNSSDALVGQQPADAGAVDVKLFLGLQRPAVVM